MRYEYGAGMSLPEVVENMGNANQESGTTFSESS